MIILFASPLRRTIHVFSGPDSMDEASAGPNFSFLAVPGSRCMNNSRSNVGKALRVWTLEVSSLELCRRITASASRGRWYPAGCGGVRQVWVSSGVVEVPSCTSLSICDATEGEDNE